MSRSGNIEKKVSKLEEGIKDDLSNNDYHLDKEYLSSSSLKLMYKDPKAYYAQYIEGEKSFIPPALQAAFDFGSYMHTLILEPEKLQEEYTIDIPVEGKTLITEAQNKLAGKMLTKYKEASMRLGKQGAEQEVRLSSFIEGGVAEESFFTTLEGVKVKCRSDYRREFYTSDSILECLNPTGKLNLNAQIIDVKTTSEEKLTIKKCEKICHSFGYALSAALYVDIIKQVTGIEHDFYFLFCSKKGTNEVRLYKASTAFLERGRVEYKEALKQVRDARESGIYYETKVGELS